MAAPDRQKQWYILRYVKSVPSGVKQSAEAVVDRFNRSENAELDLFAPTIVKVVHREGKFIKIESPLVYQYVFVRGDFDTVKHLCGMQNGFSFVFNHGAEGRYAIMSDAKMYAFRRIAMAYRNELPFFSIEDIDLEFGDKVEIVEGTFPGLVGYYMPKPKSTSGNVVLAVTQNLGTVIYDIKAKYVRVLEFSKKSKRGYDQIDAFVPKLLTALRSYSQDQPLPGKSVNELTIFCRRMEAVKLDNPKIEAKMAALLMAANHILGNNEGYALAAERFDRRQRHITSPSTRALILLLSAIIRNSRADYLQGITLLTGSETSTVGTTKQTSVGTRYIASASAPTSAPTSASTSASTSTSASASTSNDQRPATSDQLKHLLLEYDHYRPHFLPES